MAASCGEVAGTTVTIAALPSALIWGSATKATPGSSRSRSASESIVVFAPASGSSAAITSGPLVPAPKPSVFRS